MPTPKPLTFVQKVGVGLGVGFESPADANVKGTQVPSVQSVTERYDVQVRRMAAEALATAASAPLPPRPMTAPPAPKAAETAADAAAPSAVAGGGAKVRALRRLPDGEAYLRRAQSASMLRAQQRRVAATLARPTSAGMLRGAAEAAATASAVHRNVAKYEPAEVTSPLPTECHRASSLPVYTGHACPPADRDGGFTYTAASGGEGACAACWSRADFPTHSASPARAQAEKLGVATEELLAKLHAELADDADGADGGGGSARGSSSARAGAVGPAMLRRIERERKVVGAVAGELSRQMRAESKARAAVLDMPQPERAGEWEPPPPPPPPPAPPTPPPASDDGVSSVGEAPAASRVPASLVGAAAVAGGAAVLA